MRQKFLFYHQICHFWKKSATNWNFKIFPEKSLPTKLMFLSLQSTVQYSKCLQLQKRRQISELYLLKILNKKNPIKFEVYSKCWRQFSKIDRTTFLKNRQGESLTIRFSVKGWCLKARLFLGYQTKPCRKSFLAKGKSPLSKRRKPRRKSPWSPDLWQPPQASW